MSLDMADVSCFVATIHDNKYLSKKVVADIIKTWTGTADEQARLYGKFVRKSGLLYPMFDKPIHIISTNDNYIKEQWPVIMGLDPHPQVPIHAAWLGINPTGEAEIVDELVCPENATIKRCAQMMKAKEEGMNLIYRIIDPAANAKNQQANGEPGLSTKQLFALEDIACKDAKKDFDSGYHLVVKALQGVEVVDRVTGLTKVFHKFHVQERCIETIYEFCHCIWEDASGDKDSPQRQVKHRDHMVDIVRYLLKEFPQFEEMTTAPKSLFKSRAGGRW